MTTPAADLRWTGPPGGAADPERSGGSRRRLYLVVAIVLVVLATTGVLVGTITGRGSPPARYRVADDFERRSPDVLGSTDGRPWETVAGTFGIDSGSAIVRARNTAGPRSLVVTDVSATNGTISVTAGKVVAGWGIVFRYAGPYNYWYLQAVPKFATFNLVRLKDGVEKVVATSRLTPMEDGMRVDIVLDGASIDVRVRDRQILRVDNLQGVGALRAGLITTGVAEGASWNSFSFEPNRSKPGPAQVTRKASPTTKAAGSG